MSSSDEKLIGSNSSFASSSGFSNWGNAQIRIQDHERSKEHIKATLDLSSRLKVVGRIDKELTLQVEEERHYWRRCLSVSLVY